MENSVKWSGSVDGFEALLRSKGLSDDVVASMMETFAKIRADGVQAQNQGDCEYHCWTESKACSVSGRKGVMFRTVCENQYSGDRVIGEWSDCSVIGEA